MILWNGQFVHPDEAKISYEDRGYYFGDGIYEVCRVYHGVLYETKAHLNRLFASAQAISLSLPYSAQEIAEYLTRLTTVNQLQTGIVYLQFTRGAAPRVHHFPEQATPVMMGFTKVLPRPLQEMTKGIKMVTTPDIRWLRCDIKSLNLLPNTMAKQQARDMGIDDAIFHRDGIVTECTSSNIMMIKNGILRTHPANQWILHGITRMVVLRLAQRLNLPIEEKPFTLVQLSAADEVFICSTTAEITPVVEIDGQPVANGKPGSITKQLQGEFRKTFIV